MSIPVELTDVERQLAEFDRAYLLTTSDDRVKVVSVRVRAAAADADSGPGGGDSGGEVAVALLVRAPGGGSLRNVAANPVVTLLFPPVEHLGAGSPPAHPGFSLLVDGRGEVQGDDVRVIPTGAVLHKPAP